MKIHLLTGLLLLLPLWIYAQTYKEWQNPEIIETNRHQMHTHYFAYESSDKAKENCKEKSSNFMSLHGYWKFNWVKDADARPTNFWKKEYNDKSWTSLPVPGIWELHGFGDPIYLNVGYAWRNQFKSNPPEVPVENNHVGSYRKEFYIPADWKGKDIFAHFGSVTSNIYLWINGRYVGYSEDSKLEAEFDVTRYLIPGQKNLIAFQVFRWCDGTYLEDQDFFRFSGVARDCYLYAREKSRIEDIRITPDLDENYCNGRLTIDLTLKGNAKAELKLYDAQDQLVKESSISKNGKVIWEIENPEKWSAEVPYLYTLIASTSDSKDVIPVQVGFRKIELKNAQILVNGQPVLFKGANRHEIDPDGGYVVSKERMLQDIRIMKQFNINAVRTCHYPDDSYWYDLCDRYGIYMVAEANVESHGMGYGDKTLAKNPAYRKAHLSRNMRNVARNFNHPSIIFWSLGNEAGYGPNFEEAYEQIKKEDPSRAVQYEQANYKGKSDIHCPMYINYENSEKYCLDETLTKPFIQCEYAHAMGNSEGGFKEYWDLIRKYPKYQGGFIWDFVDQSIRWKGKDGVMIYGYGGDFNRYDASDVNFCDNGLISPDRIPNPHMYEVGYFYQNIWTSLISAKDGIIEIYNENFFQDLSGFRLNWSLLKDGKAIRNGHIENLDVNPQERTRIELPTGDIDADGEWLLNVAYEQKHSSGVLHAGHIVAKQQLRMTECPTMHLKLGSPEEANRNIQIPAVNEKDHNYLIVSGENFNIEFKRSNGFMTAYKVNGSDLLKDGEALTPNFWRAPTDNDFGAGLQQRWAVWKNPVSHLIGLKAETKDSMAVIEATYQMENISAILKMTYTISNEGEILISQDMKTDKRANVCNMFRFGMQLPMPKSYETIEYYGRGPIENYADRNHCTDLGIFRQSVTEQFYPYIRPQENGLHSDIRWWRVLNAAGNGIEIISNAPFYASALHYTIASLDEGMYKKQGHSQEVKESDLTNVCIDKLHAGLGCINSWGTHAIEKYQIPYQDYNFSVILRPVFHKVTEL